MPKIPYSANISFTLPCSAITVNAGDKVAVYATIKNTGNVLIPSTSIISIQLWSPDGYTKTALGFDIPVETFKEVYSVFTIPASLAGSTLDCTVALADKNLNVITSNGCTGLVKVNAMQLSAAITVLYATKA
jgi:hypothetical protein